MSLDETKRPEEELISSPTDGSPATDEVAEEDRFAAFINPVKPEDVKPKKGKMNPRIRTLLIALITVVALIAVLVLIPLLPDKEPLSSHNHGSTDGDSQVISLLNKTSDNDSNTVVVPELTIQSEKEKYTIRFDDKEDVYRLVGYEDIDLDEESVATLIDGAAVLNASQKVAQVTSLSEYGLDKPDYTVTITYYDAGTASLLIGDATPDAEGFYVKLADSESVYICSQDAMSPFRMSYLEYVQTTLVTPPTVKDDDENGSAILRRLTMTGKNLSKPLTIRRSTEEDGMEMNYFNYIISSPYKRGIADQVIASLTTMTSLTASQGMVLHPTEADLARYGFHNPLMVAELTLSVETTLEKDNSSESSETEEETTYIYYGGTDYKITIGSTTEDGDYLVMIDGINAIYLVSYSALSPIAERTYENTVNPLLFLKDITQLSRVEVKLDGTVYSFKLAHHADKEESDEKMTVTMAGKPYDTENFRSLYQLMMEMQRYGATTEMPAGQPQLSISIFDTEGKQHLSVELFPLSGSLYAVRTTEGELFTTKASNVTHFIKQLDNYLNNKEVLSLS